MTPLESRMLKALEELTVDDVPPRLEDLRVHLGLGTRSWTHQLIKRLEEKGLVTRVPGRARSIKVVRKTCPHCGGKL